MDATNIIRKMSLKEKVGQLFQIGFPGTVLGPEIKEMIQDYYIGGIIYFRRNLVSPEQVRHLSQELQAAARQTRQGLPLIISTDQEGGVVTRVKGITHFPGNMVLGATRNPQLAYRTGKVLARELKSLGINMNLAPVLDVNNNSANPVIGVRSFGEDPELVAELGKSYFTGLQEEGVIACGKHFPGHGDTATDSHLALPVIEHERERLECLEFYPFKKAIQAGIASIMTAHVYFPAVEPKEGIPATLSYQVLTELLRRELGFKGLIVTDCLEMEAIARYFGTVKGAVRTLEAGSDLVLISHSIEKAKQAIAAVLEAVEQGRLSEERIDASVNRILEVKAKYLGLETEGKQEEMVVFNSDAGRKVAREIARQGLTLLRKQEGIIPLQDRGKRIWLMDFSRGRLSQVEDEEERLIDPLRFYLEQAGYKVEVWDLDTGEEKLPPLTENDFLILFTYDARCHPEQVAVYEKLKASALPLIVVALRSPYDLEVLPAVENYITTYDYSPFNLEALGELLTGELEATGKLPVSLKGC